MYNYDHFTELDESMWMVFNSVLGENKLYRVSYTYNRLILIFTSEKYANEFRLKYISKVTCDISSISFSGLVVIINDHLKANDIIVRAVNEYKNMQSHS